MVAVLTKYESTYESASDLMENNATDGGWRGQFREKFEERSAEIDKIKAGINAEIAINNVMQAQQAQATQYIINPITGEVVETDGSYEDGLSVAAVLDLVERGASDDEIAAALDDALGSIAGKMASDKKNAKKQLAHLLELLHVLELSMKQVGKNVELQNSLRHMQERMSKLMQTGDVKQIQEFLRSSQLREVLSRSVQQSRQGVDSLRAIQELTRNLAQQAKQANLPRELALQNLQQASRDILQSQLRDMVNQLRDAYTKLSKEFKQETDPAMRDALKNSLRTITEQARNLQELARQSQKPELTTRQFDLVRQSLQQLQAQTMQLAANKQLGQVGQQVAQRLALTQAASLQALDARLAAQRVTKGNFNIASQAAGQDVLANLKATEKLWANGHDPVTMRNAINHAQESALKETQKPVDTAKSLNLSAEQQKALGATKIDQKQIQEMVRNGDLKGANQQVQNALEKGVSTVAGNENPRIVNPEITNPKATNPQVTNPQVVNPQVLKPETIPKDAYPKIVDPKEPRITEVRTKPEVEPKISTLTPEQKQNNIRVMEEARKGLGEKVNIEEVKSTQSAFEKFSQQATKPQEEKPEVKTKSAAFNKFVSKAVAGGCPACGGGSCGSCGSSPQPETKTNANEAEQAAAGQQSTQGKG